jgi:tRNA(Ile)-lysidine synthase
MPSPLSNFRSHPLVTQLLAKCAFDSSATSVDCAVSGGPDSMALLVLAVAQGFQATAWHVDHGLRPESVSEATFVHSVAKQLGANFESRTVHVEPGSNLEARARAARFEALPEGVLTGHTADDQAETVLINLLRGSATRGLAGMQAGPNHPILQLRRSETHALCNELGIELVHDSSNEDERFQRNKIRQQLLPLLDAISQRDMVPVLARQAELLRDDENLLNELALTIDPTDAQMLAAAPVALARRAVRAWLAHPYPPDSATVERVLGVARGEATGCDIGLGRQVRRSQQQLRIVEL